MLKVSKNSWHYRLAYNSWPAKLMGGTDTFMAPVEDPGNLCTYMRQIFKPIVTSSVVLFFLYGMLASAYLWLTGEIFPDQPEGYIMSALEIFHAAACMFGVAIWFLLAIAGSVIALVLAMMYVDEEVYKPWKERREGELPADYVPRPNIVARWVRSFHDKTCPLLEIEDEDESVQA